MAEQQSVDAAKPWDPSDLVQESNPALVDRRAVSAAAQQERADREAAEARKRQADIASLVANGYSDEAARRSLGLIPYGPPPPPSANPAGNIVFADPRSQPVLAPTIIPAHEEALVNPKRQQEEQNAYEGKRTAIAGESGALEGVKDANTQMASAQGGVSEATARGWAGIAERSDKAASEAEDRSKASSSSAESFRKSIDAFSKSLATQEVDPDRLWHNASTGQKITWSIARVLGGLAQGMMHTSTNQVADQLDARIRADVDAQKANYQIKRGRLSDMENLYGLARQQTNDAAQAHALAVNYGLEAAKARVNQLVSAAGTPVAAAWGAQANAAIGVKQSENTERSADVGIAQVQRGIAENQWVRAHAAWGGGKIDSKNVFRNVDGAYYAAKDEKSKEILASSAAALRELNTALDTYQESLSKLTAWDRAQAFAGITTPNMAVAQSAHTAATSIERKAQKDGVWKQGEQKMLDHNLKGPEAWTGDPAAQMSVIRSLASKAHNSTMITYAPDPVVTAQSPVGARARNIPTGQVPSEGPPPAPVGSFVPAGAKARGGYIKGAREEGGSVLSGPATEPGGVLAWTDPRVRIDEQGRGFIAAPPPPEATMGASLSGPAPKYSSAEPEETEVEQKKSKPAAAAQKKERKLTPDELMAEAGRIQRENDAKYAANLAVGPSIKRVDSGDPGHWEDNDVFVPPPRGAPPEWLDRYMAGQAVPVAGAREEGGPVYGPTPLATAADAISDKLVQQTRDRGLVDFSDAARQRRGQMLSSAVDSAQHFSDKITAPVNRAIDSAKGLYDRVTGEDVRQAQERQIAENQAKLDMLKRADQIAQIEDLKRQIAEAVPRACGGSIHPMEKVSAVRRFAAKVAEKSKKNT